MTYTLSIAEAASQLSELVHRLHISDNVVLVENDVPIAEIVPSRPALHTKSTQFPTDANRLLAVQELHSLREYILATPGTEEITDDVIRAEIDAYRSGQ